jgi:hypothetical protein
MDTLHQILISRTWVNHLELKEYILNDKINYFNEVLHVFDWLKESNKVSNLDMKLMTVGLFHMISIHREMFHVVDLTHEIHADMECDAFDIIRFYREQIKSIDKIGDANDKTYLYHTIGENSEYGLEAKLSLFYQFLEFVDIDAFERIHFKEVIDKIKDTMYNSALHTHDILLSEPLTIKEDDTKFDVLLIKDKYRFGYGPIKINETVDCIASENNYNGYLNMHHQFDSSYEENVHCESLSIRDELIRIPNEE